MDVRPWRSRISRDWNSCAYKLLRRDEVLLQYGVKRQDFPYKIVNNSRFLVLPWVSVKNLASYILSHNVKQVMKDWSRTIGTTCPLLLETFVDSRYFTGTCYRAANWIYLGQTKGNSKSVPTYSGYYYHGNRKAIFVYPLNKSLRFLFKESLKSIPPEREIRFGKTLYRRKKVMIACDQWNLHIDEIGQLEAKDLELLSDELACFHAKFSDCFKRSEQEESGQYYLSGLLSSIERKNVERIALELIGEKGVRKLPRLAGRQRTFGMMRKW